MLEPAVSLAVPNDIALRFFADRQSGGAAAVQHGDIVLRRDQRQGLFLHVDEPVVRDGAQGVAADELHAAGRAVGVRDERDVAVLLVQRRRQRRQ